MSTPAPSEEKLDAGSRVIGGFMAVFAVMVIYIPLIGALHLGLSRQDWAGGAYISMFGAIPIAAIAGAIVGPDKVKWCLLHLFLQARPVHIRTTLGLWLAAGVLAIGGLFLFAATVPLSF